MVRHTLVTLSMLVIALATTAAFELKKLPPNNAHNNKPAKEVTVSAACLTKDDIRQIFKEELAASANTSKTPVSLPPLTVSQDAEDLVSATTRSTKLVLIDEEGRRFDYDPDESTYRDIPSTMCSASSIASSTASNQAAFAAKHSSLRAQLNNCTWKVPKPSPLLAAVVSSTAMAAQANTWTQNLKSTQSCGLVHSSQTQRTVTFTLDNGTQVTSQYTGENLAYRSVCLAVTDTNSFNTYQAQYCSNAYLYTQAATSWWNEISSYSSIGNGNFLTQTQLNSANSNGNTQVGHWTQMAWASSTVIGGAAAECSTTKTQTWSCSPPGVGKCGADGKMQVLSRCFSWVITGRYYKGGNYNGQNPYTSNGQICQPTSG